MRQRTVIRYSVSFKQQVIEQLESGLDSGIRLWWMADLWDFMIIANVLLVMKLHR